MTAEQFAYWLQGFSELNPALEAPSPEQWKAIQDHLKTVFVKVTPAFPSHPSHPSPLMRDWEKALRDFPQTPLTITC